MQSRGKVCESVMSVDDAFSLLGKHTFEERNFNCGACGSFTCTQMAERIATGLNVPENCVWKTKRDLQGDTEKISSFSSMVTGSVFKMTEELQDTVNGLSSKNKELFDALKSINEIALTIHLLSFNASTAGAGFNVIAQRIKELSDESAAVQDKMEMLIKDNKKVTTDSVEKLDSINAMMQQIGDAVEKIAASDNGR